MTLFWYLFGCDGLCTHKWLEGTIPLFELCVNVIFDGLISCKAVNYDYKIIPFSPSHAKFCGILVHCFNTFISHYRWDAKSTKFLGPITSRQKLWKVHTKSGQPPSTTKYQLWRENRHFPKWSLNQRPTYEMTALVLKIFSKSSSKKKPSTYSY